MQEKLEKVDFKVTIDGFLTFILTNFVVYNVQKVWFCTFLPMKYDKTTLKQPNQSNFEILFIEIAHRATYKQWLFLTYPPPRETSSGPEPNTVSSGEVILFSISRLFGLAWPGRTEAEPAAPAASAG